MESGLNGLIFAAAIDEGYWVRNGRVMKSQRTHYVLSHLAAVDLEMVQFAVIVLGYLGRKEFQQYGNGQNKQQGPQNNQVTRQTEGQERREEQQSNNLSTVLSSSSSSSSSFSQLDSSVIDSSSSVVQQSDNTGFTVAGEQGSSAEGQAETPLQTAVEQSEVKGHPELSIGDGALNDALKLRWKLDPFCQIFSDVFR